MAKQRISPQKPKQKKKPKQTPQPAPVQYDHPLEVPGSRAYERRSIPKSTIIILVLVVLGLGSWLFVRHGSSLRDKTLENGSYTYKLRYYNGASQAKVDGYNGLKYSNAAVGTIRPAGDSYLRDCAQLGQGWKAVFNVTIDGVERPVCTATGYVFYTNFDAQDAHHMVNLTYREVQSSDDYKTIKDILQSIQVSKR